MIETLIALGVPQRFARAVLIALGVILLLVLLGLGKCVYDNAIVDAHDDKINARISADGRAGEAAAADERQADAAAISNQSEEVRNATQDIPDRSTSPRQHARACVILRQQAGASGVPASAGC